MKSRKELTETLCGRYRGSDRRTKDVILGEFCESTQYNRAYAAMLLRGCALRRTEAGPILPAPSACPYDRYGVAEADDSTALISSR
jgi:hypothetical protein